MKKAARSKAVSENRRRVIDRDFGEASQPPSFLPLKDRIDRTPITGKTETQKRYINAIKNYTLTFATGPAGTGKAQPLDAKIKTPNGWSNMGDIRVGDQVTGSNGKPTDVTGVFPQGEKEIFKVTFADGRSTECCDEHLWRVYCYEWADKWRVIKTADLRTLLSKSSYKNRLYIQLVEPTSGNDVDLPIHPYVIGALLGDGCVRQKGATLSSADLCLIDKVEGLLPPDYELKHDSKYDFALVKMSRQKSIPNKVVDALCELGINVKSYEKEIPGIYMSASFSQRAELLRGLFDTDGTVDKKTGSPSFCTTSLKLAKQVQYLIRSAGGIALIGERNPSYTHKEQILQGRKAYCVNVRMIEPELLFSLERKAKLARKNTQYRDNLRLRIKSIESAGAKQAQCISVAAEDHLYVTDDFVVTHNTWLAAALAAEALENKTIDKIIITRPAVEAGENLGFLPGEIEDKFSPYLAPFKSVLEARLGKSFVELLIKSERIVAAPLAYMRGHTFTDSYIILDEGQNTTPTQMKMFLTRIGENCKVIVNGDVDQKDIRGDSGLDDAIRRCSWIPSVKIIEFRKEDIVRSGLVQEIVSSYASMTPISAPR